MFGKASFPIALAAALCFFPSLAAPPDFSPGENVRLKRGEMLVANGKEIGSGAKGEIFSVIKKEPTQGLVFVAFWKEENIIAAGLPAEALEAVAPTAWDDLWRGVEAFREQRFDQAKAFLLRAAGDKSAGPTAAAISTRIDAALATANQRVAFQNEMQKMRDTAAQLAKSGFVALALALDEGADRLAARVLGEARAAPSKIDRDELAKRVAIANRSLVHARQLVGQRKLIEAWRVIKEGLKAESARPELLALREQVERDRDEADEQYMAAMRMKKFPRGEEHALNAIERGLKLCADHTRLRELKQEMQALFEQNTAPVVTPAFLKNSEADMAALEKGRKLYTTRCTECHDLELLGSRSPDGWRKIVGSMARRAHLDAAEESRIVAYLAAAQQAVQAAQK